MLYTLLSPSTHSSLQKHAMKLYFLFYCLTVLSHQYMGHIRDSLHEAPQKGEGGEEISFHTGLVTQLKRKQKG